jgi:MEDS: MEthanogen/methylotroph, DcmR Sensory domain
LDERIEGYQSIGWTLLPGKRMLVSHRGAASISCEENGMKKVTAPIPFAGSQLDQTRHVCAFFNSADEEYRVLLPFIKGGFQSGHKAIHVVNPDQLQDHLQRLAEAGIDPEAMQRSGQLEVRVNTEVYLPDGRFDADRMISAFEQAASGSSGEYPLSRICCRMDWTDQSQVDDVIEFESRVNEVWSRHEDAVICTYRPGQFRGDEVIDIMRTHPMVIIGGILQQNPFYIAPDRFLQEFRQRRSRRKISSAAA